MLGAVVILSALATALAVASSLRPAGVVSWLLTAYLVLAANAVVVTVALSPSRLVSQGSLAVAQGLLLAAALALWVRAGRPSPPFAAARRACGELAGDPLTALFLGAITILLGYELFLALTGPPNNWDALHYHLARVAAWAQYHGYHWIANAPDGILNSRQPVAEQEILFLFVATKSTRLFALPQFVAELALLVSIYGSARRLGFAVRPSACAAALFATFSLVMLEATTAQNDLVAASFPAVAAYFVLGELTVERLLSGGALGIGLGVKLTTVLVWPVLLLLAARRGRRAVAVTSLGALGGFALVGMWGYLLNLAHTGRVLGQGRFSLDVSASPSYPGSVVTGVDLLYKTMDRAVLSNTEVNLLAVAGLLAALALLVCRLRRSSRTGRSLGASARVAVPFAAPLIVIGSGGAIAYFARWWGHPVRGPGGTVGSINHYSSEDQSAFGPIGTVVLLGAPILTALLYAARRVDLRQLALALALPLFLVLSSLELSFNAFLTRFLLVPAALTAPLLARLFRGRATTAAYAVAGCLVGGLTITHGRPWSWHQPQTLPRQIANGEAAYLRAVPPGACVGAILNPDEPSYLLYGPELEYHLEYFPGNVDPLVTALRQGLFYVVISTGANRSHADEFRRAGWRIRQLGGQWLLAREPGTKSGSC